MKLNKLFLVLAVLVSCYVSAQNDASDDKEGINPTLSIEDFKVSSYTGISDVYKSAYGSPYLDGDLRLGTLLKGNDLVQAYMRYNIFYNEIEIADNPNTKNVSSLIKNKDTKAVINGKTYTYVVRNVDGQTKGEFYEIVSSGSKYDLYKKNRVRYISPRSATTSLQSDRPGKFVQSFEYFMVSNEGKFMRIPQKRKKLLKSLNGNKDLLKDFLKENKINLSEDEGVATFVTFYNSL
jgi:hypothetical protein